VSDYQAQRRGGRGKAATSVKDEDFVDKLFVANTHDTLLCFSDHGKLYWLKVYQLPQASRGSRGKPIVNLLPLQEGERISAMLSIKEFEEGKFVFMATSLGTVKKTSLALFSRPRASGIIAVALDPRATSWSASRSPTAPRTFCCSPPAARRSASSRTRCVPWAARRPACAA
jgi:DNA gyrase subunit A